MMRSIRAVAAVLVFVSSTSLARADDARSAAEYFRTGQDAFQRRAYRAAADAFLAAFKADPRAASMYNAALAWEAAGDRARALDAFEQTTKLPDLSPEQRSDAEAHARELASSVGAVEASGRAGATVWLDDRELGPSPTRAHAAPGSHEIRFVGEGGTTTMSIVVRPGETTRVEAESRAEAKPAAVESAPRRAAASEQHGSARKTFGWVALGASGVFAGSAIVLGLDALSARDAFDASGHTDRDAHDRAASLRTWTNVAWGLSAASAITGVVLLASSGESSTDVAATGNGVVVRGRF